MRNIAHISRRELIAHRVFDVGLTASVPIYKQVDSAGNKEWVADVYFGPSTGGQAGILKDVPIAPTAKQLIGDIRQPVRLERSKQGKYTIVGRAKIIPAGAQTPEGSILEPTYHETKVNLADLGLLYIADLDYEIESFGSGSFGGEDRDVEAITARDAWGNLVMGEGAETPGKLGIHPVRVTTTRHTIVQLKPWGGVEEENYVFGVGSVGGTYLKTVEHTE